MRKPSEAFQPPRVGGGAKGIRTPDLYNANVARYQLCYSPLFGNFSDHILHLVGFRCLRGGSAQVVVRSTNCAIAPYLVTFPTIFYISSDFDVSGAGVHKW